MAALVWFDLGMSEELGPVTVGKHTYPDQAAADRDKKAARWIKGCGFLSITFVVLAFVGCQALLNAPKNHTGGDDALAKSVCRESVKQQLKNPGSAAFSGETTSGGRVSGSVEAKNALGGSVTYDYTCTTSGIGSNNATATAHLSER
jgi:hypothetical protein